MAASKELDNFCRGRSQCCTPTSPCGVDEGECSTDADCQHPDGLICGTDNCQVVFPTTSIDQRFYPSHIALTPGFAQWDLDC